MADEIDKAAENVSGFVVGMGLLITMLRKRIISKEDFISSLILLRSPDRAPAVDELIAMAERLNVAREDN